MSATTISYVHLACDTCGAVRATPVHGSTAARIAAVSEGWKYAEWNTRGKNTYAKRDSAGRIKEEDRLVLPSQWDCCPDCPLPDGPEAAHLIREKRAGDASAS